MRLAIEIAFWCLRAACAALVLAANLLGSREGRV